jgi:hypothetical protein
VHFSRFGMLYREKSGNPVQYFQGLMSIGQCAGLTTADYRGKKQGYRTMQFYVLPLLRFSPTMDCFVRLQTGVARFFLVQKTKTGKKLPKWPQK